MGQATSSPWSFTLPSTSAYTTGVHVVRARARDAAGNQSAWSSARVTFGGNEDLPQTGSTRTTLRHGLAGQGTAMAWSPDGRLFICEQGGTLRVVKNGVAAGHAVRDAYPPRANGERGLLGVAFHPQFASNQFVYVYYTVTSGGVSHNRISRFTAQGDVAQPGSETIIADLPNLSSATNHNGGALHFGPDGKLYAAVGDNATPRMRSRWPRSSARCCASTMTARSRRTIRSTPAPPGSTAPSGPSACATRSASRSTRTAAGMFINDVGQSTWEEIDRRRGPGPTTGGPPPKGPRRIRHTTRRCSPTGTRATDARHGHCDRGRGVLSPSTVMFPSAWVGHYFFGDYGGGFVNRLDPVNGNAVYAFARLDAMTDIQVGA